MTFKAFIIQKLSLFFMLSTLITIAIYISGSIFDAGAQFGYRELLSPLEYAGCCVIPTFATYSRRELTTRELMYRMILELMLIEAVMMVLAFRSTAIDTGNPAVVLTIAGSVLVIYILARLFIWLHDSAMARQINSDLQKFQQQHER